MLSQCHRRVLYVLLVYCLSVIYYVYCKATTSENRLFMRRLSELTVIYMSSHTASRKSMARKALYFARRRTDRSLETLSAFATINVWNALSSHRSSMHASTVDGAVVAQLQFYADVVNLVASASRSGSSVAVDSTSPSSVVQLVDVYGSLIDCVGYLGAERAACTAFLPPSTTQLPHAVCNHVDNREMFLYAQAALAAEICFRTFGRRRPIAAAKSTVLTAVRMYSDVGDGLAACRRRLLPDFGTAKRAQMPSTADVWKCGRARRIHQLRRLQLNLNKSVSDEADFMLGQLERDIIARWIVDWHAAFWRLTVAVAALLTSAVYLLIGFACQCKTLLRRWCSKMTLPSPRHNVDEFDVYDIDSNDLEGHLRCVANPLRKSTSV